MKAFLVIASLGVLVAAEPPTGYRASDYPGATLTAGLPLAEFSSSSVRQVPRARYNAPSQNYGAPSRGYISQQPSYSAPATQAPAPLYRAPAQNYGAPSKAPSQGYSQPAAPAQNYGAPSRAPSQGYSQPAAPAQNYGAPSRAPSQGYSQPAAPAQNYGAPSQGYSQQAAPAQNYGAPSQGYSQPAAPSQQYGAVAAPAPVAPASNYGAPAQQQKPQSQYGAPNCGGYSSGGASGGYDSACNPPQEQKVHKHIYVHVAPEEPKEAKAPKAPKAPLVPEKHYKILFIRAPTPPPYEQPEIEDLPPAPEQKTLVYVLLKKPDATPAIQLSTPAPTKPSKPEVYFIRYKSPENNDSKYGPPSAQPGAPYGAPAPDNSYGVPASG